MTITPSVLGSSAPTYTPSFTGPGGSMADGDRGVSINDFNALAAAFSTTSGNPAFNAALDSDGDLGVSINDFNQFTTRFGLAI